jgi:Fur family transcriptional regulator, ferric uptake regulator
MSATDVLERSLLRSGHRLTGPRRQLLEVMDGLGDRFTADQVVAASPGVGRATVFRTLRLMQELGVVCQVVLDDGTTAYRLASEEHHHHIVCSDCGAVSDFSSHDIEDLLDELGRRTGFEIDSHRLELYGRCDACRARLASA